MSEVICVIGSGRAGRRSREVEVEGGEGRGEEVGMGADVITVEGVETSDMLGEVVKVGVATGLMKVDVPENMGSITAEEK